LQKILTGETVGTRFPVVGDASPAKKWLASADDHATGSVMLNQGAIDALLDASRLTSLLPVGIEVIDGQFSRGDVIQILDPSKRVRGCGRAGYDHVEARQLMGQRGQKPLVHYDYLYLVE
jgi:glutamate 5-kinase